MRRWIFWLGLLISVVLLYFSLRGLELEAVWESIKQANFLWLIPGIAAYFIAVAVRTWRWSYLLRPFKHVPFGSLYETVVIGYMGNNVYPARAGELVRSYVLRRDNGVPMAFSLATILLERIIDGIVMVAFVLIGLPNVPNLPTAAHDIVLIAAGAFAIAVGIFFWMSLAPSTAERLAGFIIARLAPHRFQPPLQGFVARFVQGARSLSQPTDLLAIVLSTALAWLIETVKYWFVMHAFAMNLTFTDLMLLNGVSNLFTIIPSGPGYVGTFDAAGIGILTALGVRQELATSYTLVLHAVLWLPVTLLGAFFMLREGLRWTDFRKAEESVAVGE
ncbi:MAG: flippase-like domain-containing protein [Chloroflexi bacterium]|nr:flippase-like domain-containing protein [Chloroflexota bacterium]MCL5274029.1 flippase-like domain-containing protein [Chloroflexota bacterium]